MFLEDYDTYRTLYIKHLNEATFPWRPAYYYYCETTDDIDMMSFAKFKEHVQLESLSAKDKLKDVSEPIYDALDKYFNPVLLMTKDSELIRVI